MANVTFKVGGLGPFEGILKENILGHEYFLEFEEVATSLDHLTVFNEVTIYRPGRPDLELQEAGKVILSSKDAGKTTSGEIPLRRR